MNTPKMPRFVQTYEVKFVQSSDLFREICNYFKIDSDNFAGDFSDACTAVSYGDASHTLINDQKFIEVLEGMDYNFTETQLKEISGWLENGVMIDLES